MPWRARICDWRYKGQWSAYFATSTCATSRSVGKPPAISLAGAAACTTPSWQLRQAYFGRRVTSTGTVARLGVMLRWLLADADRWRLGSATRSQIGDGMWDEEDGFYYDVLAS